MIKTMHAKLFPMVQILGCIALYISLFGDFSISGPGLLLAVPIAIVVIAASLRAERLRGRLVNKGIAEMLLAAGLFTALYFPLISHGAIYLLHEAVGRKEYILAESDVTATHGVGGRLCRREIVLTYPGVVREKYCISREFYNEYLSSQRLGSRVQVIIKNSFLGRSLESVSISK